MTIDTTEMWLARSQWFLALLAKRVRTQPADDAVVSLPASYVAALHELMNSTRPPSSTPPATPSPPGQSADTAPDPQVSMGRNRSGDYVLVVDGRQVAAILNDAHCIGDPTLVVWDHHGNAQFSVSIAELGDPATDNLTALVPWSTPNLTPPDHHPAEAPETAPGPSADG